MELRAVDTRTPLQKFIEELAPLLGAEGIVQSSSELELRTRETSHQTATPLLLLYPSSTEDVQAVMASAQRHHVRIHVASRGENYGYGGNNFTDSATAVMVLSRMNRILEVHEDLAYAVIEPGVTYTQLNDYLKAKGHKLWIDTTDGPPTGSVLGNALDRGIGETPYGDHFGNICGMEVVLPTGERIHTGGGSPNHAIHTWHTHKWGVGPYVEGIFTQSNFGIVTRAGIWLMPEPEAYQSYLFELNRDEDLGAVIDEFRELALRGVVSSKLHLISDFVTLCVLTQKHEIDSHSDRLSDEALRALRSRHGVAVWSGGAAIYGSKEDVAHQRRVLKRRLGRYGKLTFFSDREIAVLERLLAFVDRSPRLAHTIKAISGRSVAMAHAIPHLHRLLQGVPTHYFLRHAYFKMRERPALPLGERLSPKINPARDGVGLTWFAPILPFRGSDIVPYLEESKALFASHGFDFYMAMMMMNPRSAICLMGILFDKTNPDEVRRAGALYDALLDHMYERNYQQYRNGIAGWPRTFERAEEMSSFLGKLKAALDPRGILAPGKYGVDGDSRS